MREQLNWAYWIPPQVGKCAICVGDPGEGKTHCGRSLAQATSRHFINYEIGKAIPEYFTGFPGPGTIKLGGAEREVMKFKPDVRLAHCIYEPSVLFLDELTNGGGTAQAAALTLVEQGLPHAWMYGACNPPERAANGVPLTPPLVNRIVLVDWENDDAAQSKGYRNRLQYPLPLLPLVPSNWLEYTDKWGPLVDTFLTDFPRLRKAFPKDLDQASEPWPSPRQWDGVIRCCAAGEACGANEETLALMQDGCVGEAAGSQFRQWLEAQELPNPELIFEHGPRSVPLPTRGDLVVSFIGAVVNRVRLEPTESRYLVCVDFVSYVGETYADLAEIGRGYLDSVKPKGVQTPELRKTMAKMREAVS